MSTKLQKITEKANTDALDSILNKYFPNSEMNNEIINKPNKTVGKATLNGKLVNLQQMDYEFEEQGMEFFILDNFGFFFNYDYTIENHVTNNGDNDIVWSQREYFLTNLEFIQDFDINDNIKFKEGRVNVSEKVNELILKIANEKFSKIEEL